MLVLAGLVGRYCQKGSGVCSSVLRTCSQFSLSKRCFFATSTTTRTIRASALEPSLFFPMPSMVTIRSPTLLSFQKLQCRYAGHSKWANIKHQKGAADKKKALLFQKLASNIAIAVKKGGTDDPEANPNLKTAINTAKASDMPNNKIEQAIRVGSGAGKETKEIIFEIAGPGGSQFLVFVESTSRETERPELQRIVNKLGGSIGKDGSSMWAFKKQTAVTISIDEESDPEDIALEVDAEDVVEGEEPGEFKILCSFEDGGRVTSSLEEMTIPIVDVETVYLTTSPALPSSSELKTIKHLYYKFDDVDNVCKIFVNVDIEEEEP
eukprot:m.105868 g.105868  ORF g.105868 m.105868 type:complete len:323 (-) comp9140_c1_seq1:151-1119(-)